MLRLALLLAALAFGASAFAQQAGSLQITGTWARATPKGAQVGGGYFKITNNGSAPDRLLGGSSPVAGKFELHEMSMGGGVAKMRELTSGLEIKPGETVELKPGGSHVMFVGLKRPLERGKPFTATLQFEKAGKVDVEFKVEPIGAPGPSGHGH
jgi:periplasmic copper chaperone A